MSIIFLLLCHQCNTRCIQRTGTMCAWQIAHIVQFFSRNINDDHHPNQEKKVQSVLLVPGFPISRLSKWLLEPDKHKYLIIKQKCNLKTMTMKMTMKMIRRPLPQCPTVQAMFQQMHPETSDPTNAHTTRRRSLLKIHKYNSPNNKYLTLLNQIFATKGHC